jgi:stalled ribosome alternative rescue factor ArfA
MPENLNVKNWGLTKPLFYAIIITEREVIEMANKKKIDRRVFKKTGEELQQYLHFRKRGSRVENKKGKGSYNRQEFKKGE